MRSEFFYPKLADRQNRATWEESGKKDIRARAVERVKELLRKHSPPGLPPAVDAAIRGKFSVRPDRFF
jgi:trimethylamine--corrinoid protein Co-methyltransferase